MPLTPDAFPPIPVLNYHHVHDEADPSFRVTPQLLRQHIQYLLDDGFRPIHLDQMIRFKGTMGTAGNPLLITVDDGYEDFLLNAWPILRAFDVPCTLFVISDYLGKWNDWDGLRKARYKHLGVSELSMLAAAGITLGSHSRTHPILTQLTPHRLLTEVRDSKRVLEDRLGVSIRAIAYPGGHANRQVCAVSGCFYELGFATELEAGASVGQPYCIPRIDASFCPDVQSLQRQLRRYAQ